MKTMPISSGVDLAREDRVLKCNDIIGLFEQIRNSPNLEKIKGCVNEDVIFSYCFFYLFFS